MKVICLKGKKDTGKSMIIKTILNKFFNIIILKRGKDFCLSFMYKNKKIGICSYGDVPEVIEKLRELKKQKCHIIICASRTGGELLKGIKKMFSENIEYIICDGNKRDNEKISKFERIFKKYI